MGSIEILLEEVKDIYKDICKNSTQAYKYREQNKFGYAQVYMVKVRYLRRKLLMLKQHLSSLINGNVAFIKYKVIPKNGNSEEEHEAILVNMSDDDIYKTLELYCQLNDLKLNKNLEIKRTYTKLG